MAAKPFVWSHRGQDFKEQGKKKYVGLHWGHDIQFSSKFGVKLSLHNS